MTFELHTVFHFFPALITLITTVFQVIMFPPMRVGVSFILIFVTALVTIIPTTLCVHIHVTI